MLRKNLLAVMLLLFVCSASYAQVSDVLVVKGDADKFYPVTFDDAAWPNNEATILKIGVSDIHENGSWSGSVISEFRFHVMHYGNTSEFINADIRQYWANPLIAGWEDISTNNATRRIVIWMKGSRRYYYHANASVDPKV